MWWDWTDWKFCCCSCLNKPSEEMCDRLQPAMTDGPGKLCEEDNNAKEKETAVMFVGLTEQVVCSSAERQQRLNQLDLQSAADHSLTADRRRLPIQLTRLFVIHAFISG